MKKGIIIAGNIIVDTTYPINGWPNRGELVHVLDGIESTTGGCVTNTICDLAILDPELPLTAVGRIGDDAAGDLSEKALHAHANIDTKNVIRDGISATTLVMSDIVTKQRTFFTYLGANGRFCEEDIRWEDLNGDLFHIGYMLLLNALDQDDPEYGTKMARLLCHAQQRGFKTSADVVSEAGDRFVKIVRPAMKYLDYFIINEFEAEQTTGIALRTKDGALIRENLPKALAEMKRCGVKTWAVIHCPEGGYGLDENDQYVELSSLKLPHEYIKGTVGAGDAFCAGVLYGAEKGWKLIDAIDLGIVAAAASLSEMGATEGMRKLEDVNRLKERFERR